MIPFRSLICLACLATLAVPTVAQAQQTPLVEGSLVIDPNTWGWPTSGPAVGGGGEVGISVGSRNSIRLGAEFMTESTSEDNSGAYRRRTNAYSFLVGRQLYNGRTIKVELLAGGTVLTMAVRPIRVNPGWESLQNESDNWVAPSIGVEVPLSLTRRLGIVPGFRWHWSLIPYLVAYPHSEAHDVSRFRLAIRWQP